MDGGYKMSKVKNKNTAPTKEQWEKLYEVAGVIKNIEPWNFL